MPRAPFRLAVVLAAALLAGVEAASAQAGPPLAVRPTGPDTLSAEPGATVGFAVRVEERAGVARTLRPAAALPAGWQPLATRPRLEVAARGAAVHLVSFRVPSGARAGVYEVGVRVTEADGATWSATQAVRVEARRLLAVAVVGTPRFVAGGDVYEARAVVTNRGNVPARASVAARSTLGSDVSPAETWVLVEPGATADVGLRVRTQAHEAAASDRLRVTATLDDRPDVTAYATSVVDVVPRTGAVERPETWPLVGAVSALSDGTGVASGVGLAGTVPLDAAGSRRASLHINGLSWTATSAHRPSAWAAYEGPRLSARAGTGTYLVSPLTTTAAYGVGARVAGDVGPVGVTAHVRRPLATARGGTDVGVSAEARPGPWGRLSAHTLAATGAQAGVATTARLQSVPGAAFTLDAEGGVSLARARPIYAVRAGGGLGRLRLRGSARHTDAHQPGRAASGTARALGGSLSLGRGVVAVGTWASSRVGATRLSPEAVGRSHAERSVGLRWSMSVGTERARAETDLHHHRIGTPGVGGRDLWLARNRIDIEWGRLRVGGGAAAGRSRDDRGAATGAWEVASSAALASGPWSLSTLASYGFGTSIWTPRPTLKRSLTLSSAWAGRAGSVRGTVSSHRYEVDPLGAPLAAAGRSGRLDATLRLPRGREVLVSADVFESAGRWTTRVETTLRVPIALPLPYRVDRPVVRGRFVDAETGAGVAGVLVHFGRARAITDADGAFVFDAPAGGGHLVADRATLGADRVPVTALPLWVAPGDDALVTVGRRASLRGTLRRVDVLGTGALADTLDAGGVRGVVVEAAGVGQRHRTATDAEGRFAFTDLPAGTYTVRLVRPLLPEGYRAERDAVQVEVEGETEVTWRVVPARGRIQMLPGGRLGGGSGGNDGPERE